MSKLITYLSFFCVLSFLFSCKKEQSDFVKSISFYEDETKNISTSALQKVTFKNSDNNSLGFNDADFWFKIILTKNKSKKYLHIEDASIETITLYDNTFNQVYNQQESSKINFSIPLQKQDTLLYAKVNFSKNPFIKFKSFDLGYLERNSTTGTIVKSSFYMLILILIIINVFLAFFFKNSIFLYYLFFEINVVFGIALYDNTISSFLANKQIIPFLTGINYLLTPIASIVFCVKFLKVQKFYPRLVKIYQWLTIPHLLIICVFFITLNFKLLAFAQLIATVFYLSSWILGFLLIKKVDFALYYTLGYSILFITGIIYGLAVNFGWTFLPLNLNFLKMGVVIEILVLTIALMFRAKLLLKENELVKLQLLAQTKSIEKLKSNQKSAQLISDEQLLLQADKHHFTKREKEVFLLIVKGLNNQQIAEKLFISIHTVKYHSKNIYEKFDVANRSNLISKLVELT